MFAALQVIGWSLSPMLTHRTVPLDVAEGYAWGREWVIGTYKHPALPGWILEASRLLTGAVGWPAYIISQLFVAGTFLIVFVFGRELLGRQRATAGTLLLAGIAFYAWPTVEFNHNVAQMPIWAALPLLLWRAIERRSNAYWLLLGVVAGIGLYAKLSTLLLVAVLAVWLVSDNRARRTLGTPGPWLAVITTGVVALPLLAWLVECNFAPLTYAASRAMEANAGVANFIGDVALNVAGLLGLMVAVGILRGWRLRPAYVQHTPTPERVVRFLSVITLGPFGLAIVGALINGSGLKGSWGSSMFHYAGMLAIAHFNVRVGPVSIHGLRIAAVAITTLAPLTYACVVLAGPFQKGAPMRVNWPQAEIAQRMVDIWDRETGTPLGIVGGGLWVSDLVALTAPSRPSVFTGRSAGDSPWITPERLARQGALVLWDARRARPPRIAEPHIAGREIREEKFRAARWLSGPDIVVHYVVLPPTGR